VEACKLEYVIKKRLMKYIQDIQWRYKLDVGTEERALDGY
jgi:hypothetical protein